MAGHLIKIEQAENDLLACAAYVAESLSKSDGHAAAMEEIVPYYLAKGALDLAAELANTVDDSFARDRLLMSVADECAAANDVEYAFQLADAIEERSTRDEARQKIAGQIAGSGDFARSLEIAENLAHPYFAYVEISDHLAKAGDEAQAREIIEKIDFPSAKVAALQNLALRQTEKENFAGAIDSLERASRAAEEIEFEEEEIQARISIGYNFIEAKENGRAIEIFDRAKASAERLETVQRDSFLGDIAVGLLCAGSVELADRALDLVGDNVQIAATLVGYGREFWRRGETTEAVETLEEACSILKSQRDRDVRDTAARVNLWAAVAVEFARFEKTERAIEIAQEIPEENAHTAALSGIAQICIARGEDDLAKQSISGIDDDSQKTFALLAVSDAANQAGESVHALVFLNESAAFADTVDRLTARAKAFDQLARRYHAFEDREKMHAMFYESLTTILKIRDGSDRAAALARMSEFYEANHLDLTDTERETMLKIIAKSNS